MRTRNILLAPLLIALAGCQPEVPKEHAAKATEWLLARNTGCFQCHTTGKNLLGPAWENVSERYRNNPDAEAHLMNKVKNGGSGAWISKEMPGYSEQLLSETNRKTLVKYILSLR
ncbi:MAG: c-type cytochrome [Nitrosomonadales bacterium]|nr:c-type cytochrome [Nitrosomonadales bacterium]